MFATTTHATKTTCRHHAQWDSLQPHALQLHALRFYNTNKYRHRAHPSDCCDSLAVEIVHPWLLSMLKNIKSSLAPKCKKQVWHRVWELLSWRTFTSLGFAGTHCNPRWEHAVLRWCIQSHAIHDGLEKDWETCAPCACVHICLFVCMYMYVYVCLCIWTCVYVFNMCACVCVRVCVNVCVCLGLWAVVRVCVHVMCV